jgi:hypothetical protein
MADAGAGLRGDFGEMSRLTSRLHQLDAGAHGLKRAATWGAGLQASLGAIGAIGSELSAAVPTGLGVSRTFLAERGRDALLDIARHLNEGVGRRALFAGGATDRPVPGIDAVLADITTLAGAATDWPDYVARIDAYFSDGGAFETRRLAVPRPDPLPFPAGEGETIAFEIGVMTPEIVAALSGVALVAGADATSFAIAPGSDAAADMHARLTGSVVGLPVLQGRVGAIEARVSERAAQIDAARDDAEMRIADEIGVDQYETVTRLQDEMARLESLYAITARRARLRLTDYLR